MAFGAVYQQVVEGIANGAFILISFKDSLLFGNLEVLNRIIIGTLVNRELVQHSSNLNRIYRK
jgi:hypothetical protein